MTLKPTVFDMIQTQHLVCLLIGLIAIVAPASTIIAENPHRSADNREESQRPPAPLDDSLAWRIPINDGVNSLHLFLKLHGVTADYQTLKNSLVERPSMFDLKNSSIEEGLFCKVVQPTMASAQSFQDLQLPAIVLLDNDRGQKSGFHVVYCITEQRDVRLIAGSDMTWQQTSMDDFLRHWTGHMLVTAPPPRRPILTYLPVAFAGTLLLSYVLYRRQDLLSTNSIEPRE